jgi:hypothetical protein
MRRITVVLVLSFIGIINPQGENNSKFFSLSISGGTCMNNPGSYYFYRETEDEIINPGLYVNLGIGYGPFRILDLTEFFLSLSAGYTKVSTSVIELEYYPSNAQLIIETFPILIWGKLQTKTKLSPFIELGIGTSRLNFIESYSYRLNGTSFNYWSFAYGFGAGLNYKISTDVDLALAVDNLTNEKEHIEINDRDHKSGINLRNSVYVYYLKVNVNL